MTGIFLKTGRNVPYNNISTLSYKEFAEMRPLMHASMQIHYLFLLCDQAVCYIPFFFWL